MVHIATLFALVAGSATAFTVPQFGVIASRSSALNAAPLPDDEEKMPFYALGINLAKQVGGQTGFNSLLDEDELEIVLSGFSDSIRGQTTQDPDAILQTHGMVLNKILQERSANIMEKVKAEGEEFIANFLDCNDDAIKTDSGLVYCSMKEGDGAQPGPTDEVEVHYHGTLIDGKVFDSSVDRGQTIKFPLNGVIKGWQEGVAMMKEGGKATLVIPPELAYGEAGAGESVPPSATLKFEVELFKVNP